MLNINKIIFNLLDENTDSSVSIVLHREIIETTQLTEDSKRFKYNEYWIDTFESKDFEFTVNYMVAEATLFCEENDFYFDDWNDIEFKTIKLDEIDNEQIKNEYFHYITQKYLPEEVFDFIDADKVSVGLESKILNWAKMEYQKDQLLDSKSFTKVNYTIEMPIPIEIKINEKFPLELSKYDNMLIFTIVPLSSVGSTTSILQSHSIDKFYNGMKLQMNEIYWVKDKVLTFCIFNITKEVLDEILKFKLDDIIWWEKEKLPTKLDQSELDKVIKL